MITKSLSAIQKVKKLLKKNLCLILYPNYSKDSFSQAGEDVIIDFLFQTVDISKPVYLELGTNNPYSGNNTYLFYLRGAKGVLVEADCTVIPLIQKIRPKDKILNIGVGLINQKESDFYIFETIGLSTFSKEDAEIRQKTGKNKIINVIKVPLKSINEIIAENFDIYPDFLSIDIEGLDLSVLKTLDFNKYPIPVICAETCVYSENHIKPKDNSIIEFMLSKGYFVYADTYINSIFVNIEWFNSRKK
jgi:hypothetical protein